MGEGLGVLQDSDGATVQQQRASLGGGGITQGGGMGNTGKLLFPMSVAEVLVASHLL